jgi:catechol 2,3-dioxygenase-like lactoylglutathione lyase family enzyme
VGGVDVARGFPGRSAHQPQGRARLLEYADARETSDAGEVMIVTGLFHIAIKTTDLEATVAFYTRVLGMRAAIRPPFDFPGAWLAVPTPVGEAIFHIYAGGPALGRDGVVPGHTGCIDHVSITAAGYHDFRSRFERLGLPWREFIVPNTTYWQLFVYDPNGVQIELTFDAGAEQCPAPVIPPERRYLAGDSFFDPRRYSGLADRVDRELQEAVA